MTALTTVPPALSKYIEDRYKVVEGSQSGHCCFEFTIVDLYNPYMIGDKQYKNQFEPMCECYDLDSASKVCEALNYLNRMTLD